MLKDIINTIKLLKYSENKLIYILLFLAFSSSGIYVMLVHDIGWLGCTFLLLGGLMIMQIFNNLALSESIAASPKGIFIKRFLPNCTLALSVILTYVVLFATINANMDSSSIFHSFYNMKDVLAYLVPCLMLIIIFTILIPFFISNMFVGIILTAIMYLLFTYVPQFIYNFLFGNEFNSYYDLFDEIGFSKLNKYCIILIIIALLLSLLINPFSKFITFKINRKFSKRIFKNNMFGKIAILLCGLVGIIFTAFNFYSFYNVESIDGIYDYRLLHKEYQQSLKKCNETFKVNDCTITVLETYYNSSTNDACCIMSYEASEDKDFNKSLELSNYNSYFIFDNVITVVEGSGYIDFDYNVDLNKSNIVYIYLYLNMLPSEKSSDLSIAFHDLISYRNWYYDEYSSTNDIDKYEYQKFTFKDNSETLELEAADKNFILSEFSLVCHDSIAPETLNITTKSGKDISLVKDSSIVDGFEMYGTNDCTKYIFPELIELNNIKGIEFTNNNEIEKFSEDTHFVISENSHMKKTITYTTDKRYTDEEIEKYIENEKQFWTEYDEEYVTEYFEQLREGMKEVLETNGSITYEWTNMPEHRNIDMLYMFSGNYNIDNAKITQKVYRQDADGEEKWIEKVLYQNIDGDYSYGYPYDIEPNYTQVSSSFIYVYPEIYKNTENYTYSNQQIIIDFSYIYGMNDFETLYGFEFLESGYCHFVDDITDATIYNYNSIDYSLDSNEITEYGFVGRKIFHRLYME